MSTGRQRTSLIVRIPRRQGRPNGEREDKVSATSRLRYLAREEHSTPVAFPEIGGMDRSPSVVEREGESRDPDLAKKATLTQALPGLDFQRRDTMMGDDKLEEVKDTDGVSVPPRRRRSDEEVDENPWRRRGLVIGLGSAAAALAALVLFGLAGGAIYAKPVDQLLRQKVNFTNRPVAAEGVLVHGSLEKRDQPCEYRFVIEKNGSQLPVRFPQCVVPDTFRDVP